MLHFTASKMDGLEEVIKQPVHCPVDHANSQVGKDEHDDTEHVRAHCEQSKLRRNLGREQHSPGRRKFDKIGKEFKAISFFKYTFSDQVCTKKESTKDNQLEEEM
jgi:hypothetical protein